MTGFDWFAWWAGMLLAVSARHLHPHHTNYRIACYLLATGHLLSLSMITPLVVSDASMFYFVFSHADLVMAVCFFGLAGKHIEWLHLASFVSLLGWLYGFMSFIESNHPDNFLMFAPRWFHMHGADAYLWLNSALIISLVVLPVLTRKSHGANHTAGHARA